MPPRSFRCPACGVALGTVSRKQDHRGKPRDRLRLTAQAVSVHRILFRGTWVECQCGERVKVPKGVTVEIR